MMQSVQFPDASPDMPGTARLVKLKFPAPRGKVPVGNAATVTPLCANVPRRIERKSWRPEMSRRTADASPVFATLSESQTEPLSRVARLGCRDPVQFPPPPPPQLPVIETEK